MKTPNSKQFKKVISTLDYVLLNIPEAREEGSLDMYEGNVGRLQTYCGSPMCHGGWYLFARYQAGLDKHLLDQARNYAGMLDYKAGAYLMANDLGVIDPDYLEAWAHANKEIWGNRHGGYMFSDRRAFGKSDKPARTLVDIRNHWADVHNRARPRAKPVPHISVSVETTVSLVEV